MLQTKKQIGTHEIRKAERVDDVFSGISSNTLCAALSKLKPSATIVVMLGTFNIVQWL